MSHEGIRAFWAFWERSAGLLEDAILTRKLPEWAQPISSRVAAIHPNLDWEFGAGREAQHYFCVSAKGDPELRVLAERWRAMGPPDGPVFEFHSSRPGGSPMRGVVLDFGTLQVKFDELQFGVEGDPARERVHVSVWSPSFAQAESDLRIRAAFIALDSILGEDDVERWVGGITVTDEPPEAPVDGQGLLDAVAAMRAEATGERWAILKGTTEDGAPVFVSANLAIKRVDHLLLDTHLVAVVHLQAPTPEGLTTEAESQALNELEDELLAEIGAEVVYLGRETLEGTRILHLHAAGDGPVPAKLEAWRASHPEREIELLQEHDPSWSTLQRW